MAELGAKLLIEDNFVSGPAAQDRWRLALADLPTGWIGVRCEPATAAHREHRRGDRTTGMAMQQAQAVHLGIDYDLEVDSTHRSPEVLAGDVLRRWFD
jgi:chloramphenicol 3-O phosphotransferase